MFETMERVSEALDGAQLCRTYNIGGSEYVQVWHGGTGVNVYRIECGRDGCFEEVHYWTMMNEEGKAPAKWRIEAAMEEHAKEAAARVERGDF